MGATSALSAPCRQPLHAEQPGQAEPQQEDTSNAYEGQTTCPRRQGPPDHDNPNLPEATLDLMQRQQCRQLT